MVDENKKYFINPKGSLVIGGLNGDRGLIGVREKVDRAKKVYKMFDEDVEYKECEGHHQWFGSCYDWINKL